MIEHLISKIIVALIRRLFPLPSRLRESAWRLPELQHQFRYFQAAPVLIFLVALTPWGLGWFEVFERLAQVRWESLGPPVYLMKPSLLSLLLPTFSLALISAFLTMRLASAVILGPLGAAEYRRFEDLKNDYDGRKFARSIASMLLAVTLIGLFCHLNSFAAFSASHITLRSPISRGERRYPYAAVVAIGEVRAARSPTGMILDGPHHAIRFADGRTLDAENFFRDADPEYDRRVIEFVARKASLRIRTVKLIEDLGR